MAGARVAARPPRARRGASRRGRGRRTSAGSPRAPTTRTCSSSASSWEASCGPWTAGRRGEDHRPGAQRDVHSLAWHPRERGRAYEAGGGGTAFSVDEGETWRPADDGRDRHYSWSVATDPEDPDWLVRVGQHGPVRGARPRRPSGADLPAARRGAVEPLGGGLPDPLDSMAYALAPVEGRLFAGLADGRIYESRDGGDEEAARPHERRPAGPARARRRRVTRVVALDIGTSSARALAYDESGERVAGAGRLERYTETRGHSGRLGEFDADELASVAEGAVEVARREAGGSVALVATSCFWHSLVAIDGRGRPLTPVLTWRDTRSEPDAERLRREIDAADVHRRTGCPLHASFWPAKLRRLRREAPDVSPRPTGSSRSPTSSCSGSRVSCRRASRWRAGRASGASTAGGTGSSSTRSASSRSAWRGSPTSRWTVGSPRSATAPAPTSAPGPRAASAPRPCSERPVRFRVLYATGDPAAEAGPVPLPAGRGARRRGRLPLRRRQPRRLARADAPRSSARTPAGSPTSRPAPAALSFWRSSAASGAPAGTRRRGVRSPGSRSPPSRARSSTPRSRASRSGSPRSPPPARPPRARRERGRPAGEPGLGADRRRRGRSPVRLSGVAEGSARGAAVAALERLGVDVLDSPFGETLEPRPERTAFYLEARERQRALRTPDKTSSSPSR